MAKVLIKELVYIARCYLKSRCWRTSRILPETGGTNIFVGGGERMFSRFDFKRVLEAGGISILQPDLPCRRYYRMLQIAGMAEAYDDLAPHCPPPDRLTGGLYIDLFW